MKFMIAAWCNRIGYLFLLMVCLAGCRPHNPVIAKYLTFEGGKEKWDAVMTMECAGFYDYGGITFPFTSVNKAPDQYRYVVPSGGKYYAQAFDGKNGWKIDGFKNETSPTQLQGDKGKAMLNEADVEIENELIRYPESGITITEEKDTIIEKLPVAGIAVRGVTGTPARYYFAKSNGALIMKKMRSRNPELDGALITVRYSDFRDIDGLKIPFKIIHDIAGQAVLTITFSDVRLNEKVNDDSFIWSAK